MYPRLHTLQTIPIEQEGSTNSIKVIGAAIIFTELKKKKCVGLRRP